MRKLFRKVNDQSSCYDEHTTIVRTTGDYIYESFFQPAKRCDIKVYAVGSEYIHAECRKAPHIDGRVERDKNGHEVRQKITLSWNERAICRRLMQSFGQYILGFDILRTSFGKCFVIDVNGWSLVKHDKEYAKNCGQLLARHIRLRFHERRSLNIRALHLARPRLWKSFVETIHIPQTLFVPDTDTFDNRSDDITIVPTSCVV